VYTNIVKSTLTDTILPLCRYVDNLELHPVNGYLAEGLNVVIAADDPGVFGYNGLSYDWWAALVAFQLDLKSLKQLCENSLNYSGLEGDELEDALGRWQLSWDAWVQRWLAEM
jgi:adenosine deaminase CECR1